MTSTNEISISTQSPTRTSGGRRAVEPVLNSLALKKEWEHSLRIGRALTKEEARALHDNIDAWRSIGQSHAAIAFAHSMINDAMKVLVATEQEVSASYNFDVQIDVECEKDTTGTIQHSDVLNGERDFVEQVARAFSSANLHIQMAVKDMVSLKGMASDATKGGRFRKAVQSSVTDQQDEVIGEQQATGEIVEVCNISIEDGTKVLSPLNMEKCVQSEPFPALTSVSSKEDDSASSEKKKKRSE
jgi:hypothetical protein